MFRPTSTPNKTHKNEKKKKGSGFSIWVDPFPTHPAAAVFIVDAVIQIRGVLDYGVEEPTNTRPFPDSKRDLILLGEQSNLIHTNSQVGLEY